MNPINESAYFSMALSLALKSTAVLGTAWLAAQLLRRRSAAVRHQIWTAASAAVIVLPLLSLWLPAWQPKAAVAIAPVLFEITATASSNATAQPAVPGNSLAAARVSAVPAPWRPDLRGAILYIWVAGCFVAAASLLHAALRARRLRRAAMPSPFGALSSRLARDLEISREVAVLETPERTMPMTLGFLRPIVLFPADARGWSEDRRRMVLLHELAHVRRADVAAQFLSRLALLLNWWNPLAWTAWRESLKERERAADDLVLSCGARASDYAGHLLEIARSMRIAALGSAAVCMARRPQLEGRLLAILDSHVNRESAGRAFAFVTAAAAVALVLPLAALHAQQAAVSPDVDATIRSAVAQHNSDILEQPAQAFAAKRDFDTARALLDTAASIRAGVSGTGSVNYGVGLMKIADLEARRKNTSEAIAFYTKAVQVLGSRPEAAPAFIYLGIRSIGAKNYDEATTYFQTAQALNTPQSGRAAMWLAVVKEKQNDPSGADAMYQAALAAHDPASAEAGTTMQLYSLFLSRRGRAEESKAMADRVKAIPPQRTPVATFRSQSAVSTTVAATGVTTTTAAVRPGNGVSVPALVRKVEPQYSEEARLAKLQGTVTLSLVVGADGVPINIQVVKPLGLGLDQEAVDAVSSWTFKPGMKDGAPVPVMAAVEVNFRLL